jgi:hypothetical protein
VLAFLQRSVAATARLLQRSGKLPHPRSGELSRMLRLGWANGPTVHPE